MGVRSKKKFKSRYTRYGRLRRPPLAPLEINCFASLISNWLIMSYILGLKRLFHSFEMCLGIQEATCWKTFSLLGAATFTHKTKGRNIIFLKMTPRHCNSWPGKVLIRIPKEFDVLYWSALRISTCWKLFKS